ncbi:hypothetical protein PPACK8108_LOCUS8702 [Phakopsora pachyrhizi]|uniref:Uncharacterized protein n=1 Tax=Phakopsora pachyrhizi TaxID=170000 RepID=A0AAV0AWX1_PHAPC|nr:hypothetical protein PPACK8108_LOCUS4843 [Phakopsora pachyrhizi]CAH7673806.1 hypothetical protein PPACK8108_LOCUS8702 [Phakopsora pachyrhizi]
MFGSVLPNPNCVPGSMFHSPLPTIGPPDISNDKLFILLEGAKLEKRALNIYNREPGNSYGDGFHQQQREFGDGPRVISNHYSGGFQLFRARMGPNQNSLGRGGMGLSKNFYGANHLNQQYPQTSYNNNSYRRSFQPTPANWKGHQTYLGYNGYGNGNPYKNINHQLQICTLTIHLRQEVVVMVERVLGIVV